MKKFKNTSYVFIVTQKVTNGQRRSKPPLFTANCLAPSSLHPPTPRASEENFNRCHFLLPCV